MKQNIYQRKWVKHFALFALVALLTQTNLFAFKSDAIPNPQTAITPMGHSLGDHVAALSDSALAEIIQSVLDLSDLQAYFPKNADNSLKQINVVQYPIALPSGLNVSKGGSALNLIDGDKIGSMQVAYLALRRMTESTNSVTLSANYYYNYNSTTGFKILSLSIVCEYSSGVWSVKSSTLSGDTL